jgi:hypothetical protein
MHQQPPVAPAGASAHRPSLLTLLAPARSANPCRPPAPTRVSEIRVLKVRLADLRRQLHVLRSGAANVDVLKREVAGLGRALLAERTKVRALSEELETPLNVHRCGGWGWDLWGLGFGAGSERAAAGGTAGALPTEPATPRVPRRWRKLEGSDPGAYEMIQKIQALQKRLISKTEEAVEKDMLIQVGAPPGPPGGAGGPSAPHAAASHAAIAPPHRAGPVPGPFFTIPASQGASLDLC